MKRSGGDWNLGLEGHAVNGLRMLQLAEQAKSCPCEGCDMARYCKDMGLCCATYRHWSLTGQRKDRGRKPDRQVDYVGRGAK